ncbi:MAG: hypothetical protein JO316_16720 [Abitibacteriaceae bacterium]|nr:hypothetical protein [Abditibacteriaceae bacterium]MBV9866998.1 hypothetical protein [Abditibacteriaceae bacterium]
MKSKDRLRKVMTGVLCLLGLFALWGFRCPVVGRDVVLHDLPRTLLWWGLGLASLMTTALVALTKTPGEGARLLALKWIIFYTLGLLWAIPFLFAVNSVFDHQAHHSHLVRVLGHQEVRSKKTDQYYLTVTDWKTAGNQVTVEVDEALYDKIDVAMSSTPMVQVETAPGFLGYERIIKVS